MDESKRRFMKLVGALGLVAGFPLLRTIAAENGAATKAMIKPAAGQLALIINIEKCADTAVRDACITACRREHNLPQDTNNPERKVKWIWTEDFASAFPDQIHENFPE
jgi:hypothetical protein